MRLGHIRVRIFLGSVACTASHVTPPWPLFMASPICSIAANAPATMSTTPLGPDRPQCLAPYPRRATHFREYSRWPNGLADAHRATTPTTRFGDLSAPAASCPRAPSASMDYARNPAPVSDQRAPNASYEHALQAAERVQIIRSATASERRVAVTVGEAQAEQAARCRMPGRRAFRPP